MFTNPGSMEAGEYGLTRGTCFVARRLEVVAVAGMLWISWCALGGAGLIFNFVNLDQSASTLRRDNDSRSICPPRTRRSLTGVPFFVLLPENHAVG